MSMVIKLRNYHKHRFTPSTLLLLSAVIVLAVVAFFPFNIFAQEQEAAEITSPAPESTLEGSTATFAWSAGYQVEQYFLYLGTTPGANDLYGQSQGLNREVTVSGLPVDGSIIHVRLWSLLPADWFFADINVWSALQESSSGNIDLVKGKLEWVNWLLQNAIDDYRNGEIEEEELRKRIDEITDLKYDAIDEFPDVWGRPFSIWYHEFSLLDRYLDWASTMSFDMWASEADVLELLERAKKWKEKLEKAVDQARTK